jgi:hypothetical protein
MNKIVLTLLLVGIMTTGCNPSIPAQTNTETGTNGNTETNTSEGSPPAPELPANKPETKSSCNLNYSGCVPIASDVDCAGGSGDGPAYVSGSINVIGSDIYDLDRDHDGIACE